ncbi:hypothetical protein [Thorsellia anophelis]|uniref:Uncharacterized protein n=1 Tax=Thorsellia anophelis DSM 18579 TaxID=1123402 RepID=A0A1I0CL61_9GAMM|nr:hypothetical protein [Thorsellia anophelis]SET20396.1 hypothetical protein SAMN02583745_01671 [Thorsellia anophelis DSM 18579]
MSVSKLNWVGIRRLVALMMLILAAVCLYTEIVCEQIGWGVFILSLCLGFTRKILKDT